MLSQYDVVTELVADRTRRYRHTAEELRRRPGARSIRDAAAAALRHLADRLDPAPAGLAAHAR
jgi:hypothetical protein